VRKRFRAQLPVAGPDGPAKPEWLKVRLPAGATYQGVKAVLASRNLHTVCQEAMCPNLGECWGAGTATIMVLGDTCTRACKFCAVKVGNPRGWVDPTEPGHVGETARLLGLKYVVLTSVDRDDLPDGGSAHFARCVREIKRQSPGTEVEALTPDFQGNLDQVQTVVESGLDVFANNLETVERLQRQVRDPRAGYRQTLSVLEHSKRTRPDVYTKSSLMLGLGETEAEVVRAMRDLRAIGVDIVTFGQYLRPTKNHLPVAEYVHPDQFERYAVIGRELGFLDVVSGPLVRSSYRAERSLHGGSGFGQGV
jgi:lipoic acid synthetase